MPLGGLVQCYVPFTSPSLCLDKDIPPPHTHTLSQYKAVNNECNEGMTTAECSHDRHKEKDLTWTAGICLCFSLSLPLCELLSQQQYSSVSLELDISQAPLKHSTVTTTSHLMQSQSFSLLSVLKTVHSMTAPTNRKRRLIHTCCFPALKRTLSCHMFLPALASIIICFIKNVYKVLLFVREDLKVTTTGSFWV